METDSGCGTLHANSAADVPARLEALALAAGLPREALHAQVAAGLDAVIHVDRVPGGLRVVKEICVLAPGDDHLVRSVPALRFDQGDVAEGPGLPWLAGRVQGTGP